ncbi:uncharacterized protein [Haliotis cracherodii]|uniref:uncharacterized protein n=1 Tax=Haliotis cracherodii TaxID=6455 RepID=UPI0039EB0165
MAFGLDTDSFLNALFRMAHRRGMPKEVISDNGTNFVGAAKELKQLFSGLNSDVMKSSLANKSVKWLFNPPHAPYFGGVFESSVKSAKRAIYAILSSGDVSDEELMTAFTGAEALLNSRPLTYQSAHPRDDVPLTPNHFLHGQVGGDFAPKLDSTSFSPKKRWRRAQELIRHVWKRWMKEWLPTLNIRKKWFTPSRDIQVDDFVIVVSPAPTANLHPTHSQTISGRVNNRGREASSVILGGKHIGNLPGRNPSVASIQGITEPGRRLAGSNHSSGT